MEKRAFPLIPILILGSVLCISFLSRIIISPLLLRIERDLGISHAAAGALFLLISSGYSLTMLASGYISHWISHRPTIIISIVSVSIMLLLISYTQSLFTIRILFFLLGMAAGLYLPSGIATIYGLVEKADWGKAIGIHEAGPSLSFVFAPLLVELLSPVLSWRGILRVLGALCIGLGVLFALTRRGGRFRGETPSVKNIRSLFTQSSFLLILLFFCLVVGASVGTFSILPTFLIVERGLSETTVNLILGLSRLAGAFMVFLSGWLIDRFGSRMLFNGLMLGIGILTVLMGLSRGILLITVVFVQPLLTSAFFPVAFTLIASVGPSSMRNVAVSMIVPFAYFFGSGAVPAIMGILGERHVFFLGFALLGGFILLSWSLTIIRRRRGISERGM
jgi:NNP family nitrate/nitrite transporter-like MFS transporter